MTSPAPRPSALGRPTAPGPGRRSCGGQATVELALGLPVVVLGILVVLQLTLVGRDQVLVVHATREAARAAATDQAPDAARRGALAATATLDPRHLEVEADRLGDRVRVVVRYRSRTELPLIGPLLPDPTLHGSVTMRTEPDAAG